MKRVSLVLGITVFLVCLSMSANAQVQSLLQGLTADGGRVNSDFAYRTFGVQEDGASEVTVTGEVQGYGEFPSVVIYRNGASVSYESQSMIQMTNGFLNTLEKVGSSNLLTFVDENDAAITRGILTESAVGLGTRLYGASTIGSIFKTVGGLQMLAEVGNTVGGAFGSRVNSGAIQQITEGFGPTGGVPGETGSSITSRWEEHVWMSGKTFSFSYSVSMNPSVTVVP